MSTNPNIDPFSVLRAREIQGIKFRLEYVRTLGEASIRCGFISIDQLTTELTSIYDILDEVIPNVDYGDENGWSDYLTNDPEPNALLSEVDYAEEMDDYDTVAHIGMRAIALESAYGSVSWQQQPMEVEPHDAKRAIQYEAVWEAAYRSLDNRGNL